MFTTERLVQLEYSIFLMWESNGGERNNISQIQTALTAIMKMKARALKDTNNNLGEKPILWLLNLIFSADLVSRFPIPGLRFAWKQTKMHF